MIPGDLLSAFPHRQFNTLPGLLDSWAALPNSNPNACMPMQRGSLYHFYDGLWYDPAERRTHDLPCERRTRYRLSQPDTVRYTSFFSCAGIYKAWCMITPMITIPYFAWCMITFGHEYYHWLVSWDALPLMTHFCAFLQPELLPILTFSYCALLQLVLNTYQIWLILTGFDFIIACGWCH